MTTPTELGGWDVHTPIIPPAVVAAGEKGLFGMRAEPKMLHIYAHGVPLHPLSTIDALMERVKSDDLDGATKRQIRKTNAEHFFSARLALHAH